ncbi:Crp/Fnr family transcriptional regulator [Olivibacter jilunii]|uniref:Crp/Fnr family transcriptional regulator n=1 Tax=Olivibacter jilunii TaxID=985016 RepID=UPI0010317F11|nr:hypothetical protein [Olivibacter jilunii]
MEILSMMEELRKKLLTLKSADEKTINQLEFFFNRVHFKRNGIIYTSGYSASMLYYISRGLLKGVVSDDEEEHCLWFIDCGFIIPGNGFLTGTKTVESIEVLANTTGYSLNLVRADTVARNNPQMYRMLLEIYEESWLEGRKREIMLRKQTASDRYSYFVKNFPSLWRRLTLEQQAEYLHIGRKYFYNIKK